jgi:hypothetical protein
MRTEAALWAVSGRGSVPVHPFSRNGYRTRTSIFDQRAINKETALCDNGFHLRRNMAESMYCRWRRTDSRWHRWQSLPPNSKAAWRRSRPLRIERWRCLRHNPTSRRWMRRRCCLPRLTRRQRPCRRPGRPRRLRRRCSILHSQAAILGTPTVHGSRYRQAIARVPPSPFRSAISHPPC